MSCEAKASSGDCPRKSQIAFTAILIAKWVSWVGAGMRRTISRHRSSSRRSFSLSNSQGSGRRSGSRIMGAVCLLAVGFAGGPATKLLFLGADLFETVLSVFAGKVRSYVLLLVEQHGIGLYPWLIWWRPGFFRSGPFFGCREILA